MIRGLVAGAGGAVLVIAGLTGCSNTSDTKSSPSAASATASGSSVQVTSGSMSASAGAGTAKVSIDGNPQEINGQVMCSATAGNLNVAIGQAGTGVVVMLAEDASKVNSVALGNVNGVALGFQDGVPGGNATATKDGKTYKVTGTATGTDMANPMQPMTKPFEIEVTCP